MMRVGTESPEWAKDLLYKWVEHDDPYYGERLTVFIWMTDAFDRDDRPEFNVRIFFDTEEAARLETAGTKLTGIAASFIVKDKYKVIDTPAGLEEWTNNKIAEFRLP